MAAFKPNEVEFWALCDYKPVSENYRELLPIEFPQALKVGRPVLAERIGISQLDMRESKTLLSRLQHEILSSPEEILKRIENIGTTIFSQIYRFPTPFGKIKANANGEPRSKNLSPQTSSQKLPIEWKELSLVGALVLDSNEVLNGLKGPRYTALGNALFEYRLFCQVVVPYLREDWNVISFEIQKELKQARNRFNRARSLIGRAGDFASFTVPSLRNDFVKILPYTLYASALLEEGERQIRRVSTRVMEHYRHTVSLFGIRYQNDPLSFWEKLNEQLIEFYEAPILFGNDIIDEKWTPPRTRAQHAEIWGYQSAKAAQRVFEKVWNFGTPAIGTVKALRVQELFPLIEQFRREKAEQEKKAKKPIWPIPVTLEDILDMYSDPTRWE